jgi:gluconate 2-dehydrogenase gamma chain
MDRREMVKAAIAVFGGTLSSSLSQALLADQATHTKPSRVVFSNDQRQMIQVIAEMIIPETDTPGAIEAGVPEFIEHIVADWYTDAERKSFLAGLEALNASGAKPFLQSTSEQQHRTLEDAAREAQNHNRPFGAPPLLEEQRPFFTKIKELTVIGYYTSELGATKELRYNPVPTRFDGAYPFSKINTQWSY